MHDACLPPHNLLPFCNTSLSEVVRLDDLTSRLNLDELVGQLFMDANLAYGNTTIANSSNGDLQSTGVPRLGVPQFNYMGQGSLYRGASNGCDLNCCTGGKPPCVVDRPAATVFPQGTAFAATFDTAAVFRAAVVIADESRAMQTHVPNRTVEYRSGASSVINIARDPRWGRVPETYGECPTLTGLIALGFNKGLLGFASESTTAPPPVLKVLPVIRHLGAYAGPERIRFRFDALVTEPDLRLTYLPAWKRLVAGRAVAGAMSAISALNGEPGIAHKTLLTDTLKTAWGFDGFVLSDCDTFPALLTTWKWAASAAQGAAAALLSGGDINCGPGYATLANATRLRYVSKAAVRAAARRALRMRMRVGALQPPQTDPWRVNAAPLSSVGGAANGAVSDRIVAGGTVLLLHTPGSLPIYHPTATTRPPLAFRTKNATTTTAKAATAASTFRIALIGPSADDPRVQAHTYHGTPRRWVTLREALVEELRGHAAVSVSYAPGCAINSQNTSGFSAALKIAAAADVVVYAGGLWMILEEEDTDRDGGADSLGLPGVQPQLLAALRATTKQRGVPLVALLVSGGALAVPSLVPPSAEAVDALLWSSYYGQSARPLARILLGTELPTGRLPFTVPANATQLPPIADYRMTAFPGRTYRYLDVAAAPPLFPFGHGLGGTLDPRPWTLSALSASAASLTLPELRAAAAQPCTATTGAALTVSITLKRGGSGGGRRSIAAAAAAAAAAGGDVAASSLDDDDAAAPYDVVKASRSLLLFGALAQYNGVPSPYPRQQLLAFAKPSVPRGGTAAVALRVCAAELLDDGLGAHTQPLPASLHLWVGDAATRDAEVVVALEAGAVGGEQDDDDENVVWRLPHEEL